MGNIWVTLTNYYISACVIIRPKTTTATPSAAARLHGVEDFDVVVVFNLVETGQDFISHTVTKIHTRGFIAELTNQVKIRKPMRFTGEAAGFSALFEPDMPKDDYRTDHRCVSAKIYLCRYFEKFGSMPCE
jgi:hypothetical protein